MFYLMWFKICWWCNVIMIIMVMVMIVMVMMIWWCGIVMPWWCYLCLNHLCCISEECKLSYYFVVLRRMIYIAFTYIHVCMLVHSHIYFISCIKHQLSLHNARIVHSIHMHCRIQHHHHHHYLSPFIIIISIIIIIMYWLLLKSFQHFLFLFYFHVSSLHYYYRLDGLLFTWPVGMVNWRLYVL